MASPRRRRAEAHTARQKGAKISPTKGNTAPAPIVEQVFSPLDEEWGLLAGNVTPKHQENMAHLASGMPYAKAAQMVERLGGVPVSEATIRRHTSCVGKLVEEEENERSGEVSAEAPLFPGGPAQLAISADGAFVPLVGGSWAEARPLALAQVSPQAG
ncbi:MAG TPA: hypothetical protein VFA15_01010, partial [Nitrososphaera sp.]|nr:hypothetical protein [Nitrososphaera sp.]